MAVFPRVGGPNPTLSTVALAMRATHSSRAATTREDVLRVCRENNIVVTNGRVNIMALPTIYFRLGDSE